MAAVNLNWETWLKQGDQYLKAGASGQKSKFGTDIRYNLLSLSLESYVMAILDFNHTLPDNHTYSDLIFALEKVNPLDESLKDRILKYESIQSICSVDKYSRTNPTEEDLHELKNAIVEIGYVAHKVVDKR